VFLLGTLGSLLPVKNSFAKGGYSITALLSLPDKLANEARPHILESFNPSQFKVSVFELDEYRSNASLREANPGVVLAAGRDSCLYASQNLTGNDVLCVLLSNQAFLNIQKLRKTTSHYRFGAIVIDQPLQRQINIANVVFPSLQKFGLLTSKEESLGDIDKNRWSLSVDDFNANQAVAPQIVRMLSDKDALVAVPDKQIYTTERLRTVLLTAYGYAKPVIGYSRAYVRAGALITTFTTPGQVFRQASEIVDEFRSAKAGDVNQVYEPRYFSIVHNPSIAKSLGLVRRFRFHAGQDFRDTDFAS